MGNDYSNSREKLGKSVKNTKITFLKTIKI